MGYQPAAYTIINRCGLYYVKEPGIETGPFCTERKAKQYIDTLVNQQPLEMVVAQFDKNGNRIG